MINATDNTAILEVQDGMAIDIATLETTELNIRANTLPELVGSVYLEISGTVAASRNENVAPYALFGDMAGDYEPASLPIGNYTLTATPYSKRNQGGSVGTPLTVQFSVIETFPNQPPVSSPMANPVNGIVPLTVEFRGDNSFDDNQITAFFWDFKDGNTSTETNPTHLFTVPGVYEVSLTVSDEENLSHTATVTITVAEEFVNQPPSAIIEASTTTGFAPLAVQFTGSGSNDDIAVTDYLWDFGDGQQSTLADPSHIFSLPGSYQVSLTVSDEEGLQDEQTLSILVLDPAEVLIQGELKKWHRVQLLFNGPFVSETDMVNPFLDYRLNVHFTSPSGKTYLVPGFYAADGNAAETSADSGNKWAVRFNPDEVGQWNYVVSFRTGDQIAISLEESDGTAMPIDGLNGNFSISENDKILPDNRANGRLQAVGGHFYQFAETQTYFLKAGPDSPENMLAYSDFDNTVASKSWQPHQADWTMNDATWQQGKGTGLIGAINYLADKGMNAFSFITMNINGDGEDVWPWAATAHNALDENSPEEIANRLRYDVSKLDQWEIVFSHGDEKGMFLHFKTQETENDQLLDGGELDVQRKLYYRELIARFSHHLALNWNLGEENDIYEELNDPTNTRLIAYADFIHNLDPYDHPITVHSFPDQQELLYTSLLGPNNQITGPSIQSQLTNIHEDVKNWVAASKSAGKPWAVANDEQGNAQTGVAADSTYQGNTGSIADNRDEVRYESLWGTLLAGGYGVEYYFGYATGETDLTAEDFRSRETKWNDAKVALDFFHAELPFWQMENADVLTSNEQVFCLAQPNNIYALYLPAGQSTNLDLSQTDGSFSIAWFDPVNGGVLQNGGTQIIVGGADSELGNPPADDFERDWVILVKKLVGSPLAIINVDTTTGEAPLEVNFVGDQSADDNGIVSYLWDFADGETANTANPTHIFTAPGTYEVMLTVSDEEGLQDSTTVTIVVDAPDPVNLPPTAVASATPRTGEAPLEVSFTGSASTDDNAVSAYDWDFLDGQTSQETDPVHTFTDPGTYEVVLTVSDGEGLQDSATVTIVVDAPDPVNLPPTAVASANPPSGEAPLEVSFTGSASTDDNAVSAYDWDFLDGQTSQETDPIHTFTNPGTYEVVLTVSDEEGLQDSTTVTIVVDAPDPVNLPPTAVASANPLSGEAPLEVSFTGSASTDDNAVSAYDWDFLDGQTSQETDPIHTFTDPGTYEVVLTVSDEEGLQDSTTVTIVVDAPDPVNLPPTAVASATPRTGEAPLEVSFTGSASTDDNAVSAYDWDFLDGQTSQETDPVHTFTDPGTYEVVLTVSDGEGLQDSATVTIVVSEPIPTNLPPTAVVSATPLTGEAPLEVSFTGNASTDDNAISSYDWDFTDGQTSQETDPIHTFTDPGTYEVVLTVSDEEGLQDSTTVTIVVDAPDPVNLPPTAVASATPLTGEAPLEVSFTGNASTDDNAVSAYDWDFLDGQTSQETDPVHTFADPGTYEVVLTVSDEEGLQDSATVTIVVTDPNIEGVTSFVLINAATNTDIITLYDGIQLLNAQTENLLLNIRANTNPSTFGSVFLQLTGPVQQNKNENVAPYALFGDVSGDYSGEFLPVGNYTLSATPFSGRNQSGIEGATATLNFSIVEEISNQPPLAIIMASEESGEAPLEVNFVGDQSADDNGIVSYLWDFADGETANTANPTHIFVDPGTYDVVLTVSDGEGLQDSAMVTIVVSEPIPTNLPPTAVASATPLTGEAPLEVSFTGTASADDNAVVGYDWDFKDGQTSQETDPVHTFTDPGTYEVVLTVSDEEGLQDSDTVTIVVSEPIPTNLPPTAVASATPLTGEVPLEVSFTGNASTDDYAVVGYDWDFTDGQTSQETDPIHTFTDPGTYEVVLTVSDGEGLQDSATVTIVVSEPIPTNLPPTAVASATPLTGEAPLEVSFTGNASTDDNAVVGYDWDFIDGQTSQETDPVHTFTDPGTYEVVLTVSDGEGLQDSATVTIVVSEPIDLPPIAMATATPLTGEAPLEVIFNSDASSDDMAIVSYFWDFSDGTTSSQQNPSHIFTSPGEYLVSLTVEDIAQQQAISTVTITVLENTPEETISFTLVNATLDTDILELSNNLQIATTETEGIALNIRAEVESGTVGSVRLELTGPVANTRIENVAPYALFGDIGGDYSGVLLPEGNYTINATPYSGRNLSGEEGETVSLNFALVPPANGNLALQRSALSMQVYPNRSFDEIHLDLPKDSSSKIMEVHLYDLNGRKIRKLDRTTLKWENNNAIVPVMDIGLEEGYYIVMAVTENLQVIQTKMLVGKY